MLHFREWLLSEAAIGPQNIQYDPQGRPNFRVYILNGGVNVGLETLKVGRYKYEGDMLSNVFGNTEMLKGYKIFNWHSDLPEGAGYGPMFYDICMEIATSKGGFLASMTLVNRLGVVQSGNDFDYEHAKERKGAAGGDTSDRAEPMYKFYYEKRGDVEKIQPNITVEKDPEQATKPWMYHLYRKQPTVLPQLIKMNSNGKQPVLVAGNGNSAKPIVDMNLNFAQQQEEPQKPQQAFQGFQMNDPRTWQQRQEFLNSIGIDTAGWLRQEIMRGVKNT